MLGEVWNERKGELTSDKQTKEQHLLELQTREKQILGEVTSLIHYPALLE